DTSSKIERRCLRLLAYALSDHIDANLERLVNGGNVGEIEIKIHILWIEQNGLPKRVDSLWRIMRCFVGGGSQIECRGSCIIGTEDRLQSSKRILGLVRHQLDRR